MNLVNYSRSIIGLFVLCTSFSIMLLQYKTSIVDWMNSLDESVSNDTTRDETIGYTAFMGLIAINAPLFITLLQRTSSSMATLYTFAYFTIPILLTMWNPYSLLSTYSFTSIPI